MGTTSPSGSRIFFGTPPCMMSISTVALLAGFYFQDDVALLDLVAFLLPTSAEGPGHHASARRRFSWRR